MSAVPGVVEFGVRDFQGGLCCVRVLERCLACCVWVLGVVVGMSIFFFLFDDLSAFYTIPTQSSNNHTDGILTHEIASSLSSGSILGIDSSPSMISTALSSLPSSSPASFRVLDALDLSALSTPNGSATLYTKIFSNAALHWILAAEATRRQFFVDVRRLLAPGGTFVFEMGGMGNVAEVRAAMYAVLGPRVGREKVADVDPWCVWFYLVSKNRYLYAQSNNRAGSFLTRRGFARCLRERGVG